MANYSCLLSWCSCFWSCTLARPHWFLLLSCFCWCLQYQLESECVASLKQGCFSWCPPFISPLSSKAVYFARYPHFGRFGALESCPNHHLRFAQFPPPFRFCWTDLTQRPIWHCSGQYLWGLNFVVELLEPSSTLRPHFLSYYSWWAYVPIPTYSLTWFRARFIR